MLWKRVKISCYCTPHGLAQLSSLLLGFFLLPLPGRQVVHRHENNTSTGAVDTIKTRCRDIKRVPPSPVQANQTLVLSGCLPSGTITSQPTAHGNNQTSILHAQLETCSTQGSFQTNGKVCFYREGKRRETCLQVCPHFCTSTEFRWSEARSSVFIQQKMWTSCKPDLADF